MPRVGIEPAYDRFRAQLEVDGPLPQRRWTVALRLILALPLALLVIPLSLAVVVTAFVSWFCALVLGRVPHWAAAFFIGSLTWLTRLEGYSMLLTDRYPGFSFAQGKGAIRVEIHAESVNRWGVLFRWLLLIPVSAMTQFLVTGWMVLGIPIWLIVLVRGRMPRALFQATAAVLRVQIRAGTYQYMLTDAYPLVRTFGDGGPVGEAEVEGTPVVPTRPLSLSRGAKWVLAVIIVLGVIGVIAEIGANAALDTRNRSLQAATDTYVARNTLSRQYVAEVRALKKCSGRLDCLQRNFEHIGKDADEFVRKIDAIDYPEGVQDDVDVLKTEGKGLGATARRIANASVDRYNQVLRGSNIDSQAISVVNDATALGQRLD